MIDAVDLIFFQYTLNLAIQGLGRLQIVPERFLDHNASPAPLLLVRQSGGSKVLDNLPKKLRRRRQIKHVIASGLDLPIEIAEPSGKGGIGARIRKLSALIEEPLREPLPRFRSAIFSGQKPGYMGSKLVEIQVVDGNA